MKSFLNLFYKITLTTEMSLSSGSDKYMGAISEEQGHTLHR